MSFTKLIKNYMDGRCSTIDSLEQGDAFWLEQAKLANIGISDGKKIFGLDFHGVIDKYPAFLSEWASEVIADGHQVRILTGSRITPEFVELLSSLNFHEGISYTHLFSITDHHVKIGSVVNFDEDGKPWMDASLWNRTKALYAAQVGMDAMWDDSPNYGKYFLLGSRYYLFASDTFKQQFREIMEGRPCLAGRR